MIFRYQKIFLLLIILLVSKRSHSQVDLNLGLKAYYPFSGNANDASGNNNHPIFNNASLTNDRQGTPNSAYHFNGLNTYIQVPNSSSLNFGNQMSIALKVRPTGYYTGPCYNNMMVMKGDEDYLPGNYFIRFSDVNFGCTASASTNNEQFYSNNCVAPTPVVQLNEWYDVVWTADGVDCKLYVNCELKVSSPQTDFNYSSLADLFIGRMNNTQYPYWLNGDLDEIRIYDRPLNFDEVKVYSGCNIAPSISNIINEYTPVLALNPCNNSITVEDASAFNTGDTVLMIQMKGAVVDSSNLAAFGNIQQINNAGNYEYNYVKAITGNVIELKNKLTRQYDLPDGKVQLVRVPYYYSVNVTGTLTCLPWNGSIGGVLALNVRDTIYLNGYINVTGLGFRGAQGTNTNQALFNCDEDRYFYASVDGDSAARKGESIAELSDTRIFGKGKLASAGGGGNSHNSGGGGGANGGNGGMGGYQVVVCTPAPFDNRGIGGNALTYNNTLNKIFMGGGGGAGHVNNPQGFTGDGGNGGGIAIITGNTLVSASGFIISNGNSGTPCLLGGSACHEGMGGGGAGGSILLNINNYINNVTVNAIGGNGGVMTDAINGLLGPGGGGGGGMIWFKTAAVPGEVLPLLNGGINGTCINQGNNDWGATSGTDGINLFNLNVPVDNQLFVPNIDSVKINESAVSCNEFNFNGLGYTNTNPINSWQWNFGDNGTANTQNTTHLYSNPGVYNVQLTITDANGCKDSIVKSISVTCTTAGDTIINVYTPVLAYLPCDNSLTVENSAGYQVGDTVLIIQMKGAIIDSTNTTFFGDIIDYKNAGNYEYNYISQISGNNISLKNKLTRQYDIPTGKVQLVRAPYYSNSISFGQKLTCLPWDGSKGGILVFNVKDTLSLTNDIDVSGKGFRGASIINPRNNALACNESNYFYPNNPIFAGPKGEGIADVSNAKSNGKGPLANGGGGGNGHNSGAGGGSNSSSAGKGGKEWISCTGNVDHGGSGGNALVYSTAANKVFMGGGGGAGHCDNIPGFNPNGGNGGGIVLIKSGYLKTNNNNIIANGDNAVECVRNAQQYRCHEGMGGGGGGGTLLLDIANYLDNTNLFVKGGKGADMNGEIQGELGPGGGGGGGVTWLSSAAAIPNITISNQGGLNGVAIDFGSTSYAATPGQPGNNYFNLSIPVDTVLFKPNIDSVRFNETALTCNEFNFNGLGYTNTTPITNWQWYFGDNNTAATQNTSHTYASSGTYTVTLIATDINGCKDSIVKTISTTGVFSECWK
ncbi:MAG: PKD domain-containing protein [Ferruginibacter sp.]